MNTPLTRRFNHINPKQPNSSTMVDPLMLPVDILILEILHHLPVKTIVRFKCLSKYFKSLISSQKFINLHLRHFRHQSNIDNHILIFDHLHSSLYTLDLDRSPTLLAKKLPLPTKLLDYNNQDHIASVGYCNGLHCIVRVSMIYFTFILFNPTTAIFTCVEYNSPMKNVRLNYGFGLDNMKDDYKIVIVFGYLMQEVMVYSLKKNRWRFAQSGPSLSCSIREAIVINNNLLHWINGQRNGIVCFDLISEKWKLDYNLWPPGLDITSLNKVNLGVFEGNLCLLTASNNVWIMKEYGINTSWVKLFNIGDVFDDDSIIIRPLCYTKDELVLLWTCYYEKYYRLQWVDLVNNKVVKKAVIIGVPPNLRTCYLFHRSLVHVPPSNQKINQDP